MNYWFSTHHNLKDCHHSSPPPMSSQASVKTLKLHLQRIRVEISRLQHGIETYKLKLMNKGIQPQSVDQCRNELSYFDAVEHTKKDHLQDDDLTIMKTCGAIPANVHSAQLSPEVQSTLSDIKQQLRLKRCLHHTHSYLESQCYAYLSQDFPKISMLFE